MKKWEKEAIADIEENFDFIQVKKTMDALKWVWVLDSGVSDIPSIDEIKKTVHEMLVKSCEEKISHATGGFFVKYSKKQKYISLKFCVSEWENK